MKSLSSYIQEKLVIKKKSNQYRYFLQSKLELKEIIENRIKGEGNEVYLNDIDTSNITDMSYLFARKDFNGNISNWDVSKVTNMGGVFYCCESFNQDISAWDVSNVTDMQDIFYRCPIKEKYKPKFR